jgi:hypothetical protein
MQDYQLTPQELGERRAAHRRVRDAREAYRLNAVILLGTGWRVKDVAKALLIAPGLDHNSVQNPAQRCEIGMKGDGRTSEISYPWKCKLTEGRERCSKALPLMTLA